MATVEFGISAKDNQMQKPQDGQILEMLPNVDTAKVETGISVKHNQLQKLQDWKFSEMLPWQHMATFVLLP